jgi:hypothetical protein
MTFQQAYEVWLQTQLSDCKRVRRKRVAALHRDREPTFLREVWFPVMGSLEGVVPEYEIMGEEGRVRYLHYAFLRGGMQVNVEVDDNTSNGSDFERRAFTQGRRRDMYLEATGWRVLRLALDDVMNRPLACRELLERWMVRWGGRARRMTEQQWRQEQVTLLARNGSRYITLTEVSEHLSVCDKTARMIMRELMKQGTFAAACTGKQRIHRYKLLTSSTLIPRKYEDAPLR